MGSDRSTRTRLFARCCYGVSFGFGFVITVLTFAAMFWIAWCYFGLTVVQLSDSQRRAVVNYSYSAVKPTPSPTSAPSRSTTLATEETSINSISKFPTTASVLRGSSRGESPVKVDKKKETTNTTTLAKGDFSSRDRDTRASNQGPGAQDMVTSLPPPRGPPKPKDESLELSGDKAASILSGSSREDSEEDRIYARKVLPPGNENRPDESDSSSRSNNRRRPPEPQPDSRLDISPTKVYDIDTPSGSSRRPLEPDVDRKTRDEDRVPPRDYIDRDKALPVRDEISSSRRSNSEPAYRDPDFDREYPRRSSSNNDRDRTRYDDYDDDRGSRSRYDRIDRGRDTDDRYSKGDTRVYPDDKDLRPVIDDRYRDRPRERNSETSVRRGDDERYEDRDRDSDERPKYRDRDPDTRYRDRDAEERLRLRDSRYRDDDRYRSKPDDRYDDDRFRSRDEDRYRTRDEDRYRSKDGDGYRSRDDDRYRSQSDDKYRSRIDDDYKSRDDRYMPRDDDRYRVEEPDRRDLPSRYRDDKETSRSRADYDKYDDLSSSRPRDEDVRESVSRSSTISTTERRPTSRLGYDTRNDGVVSDYDTALRDRPRTNSRDEIIPSRISRPSYDDERDRPRDRDEDRKPYRYDDDRTILPTRTREEIPFSRSALIGPRPKDAIDDRRYVDSQRDRVRDDRYDDRISGTRLQGSGASSPPSENSRSSLNDKDDYRAKLPSRRIDDAKFADRREEVVLDHRSYSSETDDEYRRSDSRREPAYYDRIRRPVDDSKKRYDDGERYTRRDFKDDEEYERWRKRYDDDDKTRSRDTYDDDYRRYEDRYRPRDDDRYISRDDRSPPIADRKYDTYPDEDRTIRRRDPEISVMRKEDPTDRRDRLRPSSSSRDDERFYSRDEYSGTKPNSRRRYDDDLSLADSRNYKDDFPDDRRRPDIPRPPSDSKEPIATVSSREPSDVISREKRYQTTEKWTQSSRVSAADGISNDRSYQEDRLESAPRDVQLRPMNAKDVIEAAVRQSDASDENLRKVFYPVFDPRISNLTTPELIRASERRGTIITARKRRSMRLLYS